MTEETLREIEARLESVGPRDWEQQAIAVPPEDDSQIEWNELPCAAEAFLWHAFEDIDALLAAYHELRALAAELAAAAIGVMPSSARAAAESILDAERGRRYDALIAVLAKAREAGLLEAQG